MAERVLNYPDYSELHERSDWGIEIIVCAADLQSCLVPDLEQTLHTLQQRRYIIEMEDLVRITYAAAVHVCVCVCVCVCAGGEGKGGTRKGS